MATLTMRSPDGTEQLFEISVHQPFRIGRDMANDGVIRDAKVSRTHAEITFERGFFVVHDLSSANGTYVNNKKVRTAPLTDGARVRFGNSSGTFSIATVPQAPAPPDEPAVPRHTSVYTPLPRADNYTHAQPKVPTVDFPLPDPEPDTEDLQDEIASDPAPRRKGKRDPGFDGSRFEIESDSNSGMSGMVRDASNRLLFYYHAPGKLVALVAGLVATLVSVAGLAATLLLAIGSRPGVAFTALLLTGIFSAVILLLAPPRHLFLFRDEEMKDVALTIHQHSRFAYPGLRFSAAEAGGQFVGSLQKSTLSNLGRHRWWIFEHDHSTAPLGYAVEESLLHAWVRKALGSFSPLFQTNFRIYSGQAPAGWIYRTKLRDRSHLDLSEDSAGLLDRRIGLALALVIRAVEP